jgi:hypothetical protein
VLEVGKPISGFMRPVNDNCIDCQRVIDPKTERNYIVFDEEKQEWRRECAKCHDKAKGVHLGRHTAKDGLLQGV